MPGAAKKTKPTTRRQDAELDRLLRHLEEARDRAEHANQAKSRFLAAITHELRTPLHGILGYAELLTLEGGLSAKQTQRLEAMMAAGQHLLGMVNAVLDMSQIEADRLELQPTLLEMSDLVRVCLDVIRPAAEAKDLRLGPAPATSFRVLADPTRLRQVVINLLGNAVKFTPAGRIDVRVGCSADGTAVRLEVADTGPGVREIHRQKLFDTFERLNAQAVSGIEGTGLGLAISGRLIHMMGGRIGYDDNPGGGSVFWLELPACDSAAAGELYSATLPAEDAKLRILVVDDEMLNRSIAASFLANAGYQVVCAESGAAALEAASAEDFDAILMDVRMPGMNGMEATRRIRQLPGHRGQVRIVAVTAHAFAEQKQMCRDAGMDGYLSKPFKQATLLAAVRDHAVRRDGASPADAPDLPIFDHATFREAVEFLSPADIAEHVQTLIGRCDAMLGLLRQHERTEPLGEACHKLAGTGGMFGLVAVSDAARALQRAEDAGSRETGPLAVRLEAMLVATIGALRSKEGLLF